MGVFATQVLGKVIKFQLSLPEDLLNKGQTTIFWVVKGLNSYTLNIILNGLTIK